MPQYQEAFAKLDADDAGAILSFAALVGNYADDRLASFYLKSCSTAQQAPSFKSTSEINRSKAALGQTETRATGAACPFLDAAADISMTGRFAPEAAGREALDNSSNLIRKGQSLWQHLTRREPLRSNCSATVHRISRVAPHVNTAIFVQC